MLEGDGAPFHDALVRPARPDEVARLARRGRARAAPRSRSASSRSRRGVPFALDAGGFGRHTFLCGQSGSGKTYSLGVLLERLLMETSLRIVVLDPNSDYVRLGEPRAGADASAAERYARGGRRRSRCAAARAARPRSACASRELEPGAAGGAAAARPDRRPRGVRGADRAARGRERPQPRRPRRSAAARGARAARATTSASTAGASGRGRTASSLLEELEDPDGPRCLVVDLGSLADARGAGARRPGRVLERLWRRRARARAGR